ncbi:MAG: FGGY family carbohydrate kinase, partial [Syntrophothermus sp.]
PSILYGIDTRATEEIEILNREIGSERIFSTTGQQLTTQSVGPKILWFKRHEPALYARTARILSATSYLVFRLTGKYVVDYYTAPSFSPLFDLERLQWDEAMCAHGDAAGAPLGDGCGGVDYAGSRPGDGVDRGDAGNCRHH